MTIRKEIDLDAPLTTEQKQMFEALKTRPLSSELKSRTAPHRNSQSLD